MQKKSLLKNLGSLLSFQINILLMLFILSMTIGCVTKLPDVWACTEISMSRGYCIKTISDEETEVNETKKIYNKTWFQMRPVMIQLPIDSWVEIKKFIIMECKKNNDCNADIASWERKINQIDGKLDLKK